MDTQKTDTECSLAKKIDRKIRYVFFLFFTHDKSVFRIQTVF